MLTGLASTRDTSHQVPTSGLQTSAGPTVLGSARQSVSQNRSLGPRRIFRNADGFFDPSLEPLELPLEPISGRFQEGTVPFHDGLPGDSPSALAGQRFICR